MRAFFLLVVSLISLVASLPAAPPSFPIPLVAPKPHLSPSSPFPPSLRQLETGELVFSRARWARGGAERETCFREVTGAVASLSIQFDTELVLTDVLHTPIYLWDAYKFDLNASRAYYLEACYRPAGFGALRSALDVEAGVVGATSGKLVQNRTVSSQDQRKTLFDRDGVVESLLSA
ncbi:hypothetical protein Rhopal_001080-T1 [Rhodotorula paludigena]|uniref:Uncharacterized protein n=1 Tax=Rhodotorula paludigena TaxID=86838 RepID=A0AAV5GE10_9BASI|nr:hypothetical protein Rhopal_001080-T1 [Rhodotorula paludigena]